VRDYKVKGAIPATQYVDDLLTRRREAALAAGAPDPDVVVPRILHLCNVAHAAEKSTPAATAFTAIGRTADSVTGTIVPALHTVTNALLELMVTQRLGTRGDARLHGLPAARAQKLAGRLQWIGDCSYGARLHIAPFHYAVHALGLIRGRPSKGHWVRTDTGGIPEAMAWWLDSARSGRLRGEHVVPAADLHIPVGSVSISGLTSGHIKDDLLHVPSGAGGGPVGTSSDAAGGDVDAFSAALGSLAVHGAFTADQRSWSIDAKELYAIRCLLRAHGLELRGRVVVFGTDNAGNVYALNGGRCRGRKARELLAEIYDVCDELGIRFYACWVPRVFNRPADLLCKTASFRGACRLAAAEGLKWDIKQC